MFAVWGDQHLLPKHKQQSQRDVLDKCLDSTSMSMKSVKNYYYQPIEALNKVRNNNLDRL